MANTYFQFKRFIIHHDRCAMKVGTDGVLLGAWAGEVEPQNILDIGTGSGLVALMLAQRFSSAFITGIELDSEAAAQAAENAANSEFSNRVTIQNKALQEFTPDGKFDLIVCNPPFFKVSSQSESAQRNVARQFGNLSPEELFHYASHHLSQSGNFCMIFPADSDLETPANEVGLYLNRKLEIRGNEKAPIKRVLLSFGLNKQAIKIESLVIEETRGQYTSDFKDLLSNFYLYL